MKEEYDFSRGTRGAVVTVPGKTRITVCLDNSVLERFKDLSERTGKEFQVLINDALAKSGIALDEHAGQDSEEFPRGCER
jgi:uncharacterized protein (DUF4415 family)